MNAPDTAEIGPAALGLLTRTVEDIRDGDWQTPSNLDGWTVRDVVAHVTGSVAKISALIADEPTSAHRSEPADWYADDQVAALRAQIDRAVGLLPTAPTTDKRLMRDREIPLRLALSFPLVDAIVHAWDIERSLGRSLELPDDLVAYAMALTEKVGDPGHTNPNFAPPKPDAPEATPTQQLMARLGRASD